MTTSPDPLTLVPKRDIVAVRKVISDLETLRESKVISFYLADGSPINWDQMPKFRQLLRELGKQKKIDLWLRSRGGTTEVPWQLVQMIREHCDEFGVLVPEIAHSAATHIGAGADELVMGAFSFLSPVDPTRTHQLLVDGNGERMPVSVQDLKHVMKFITEQNSGEPLDGAAYAAVIGTLFEKIHPLVVGGIEQSYSLAKSITKKMLETHMDASADKKKIQAIADTLGDKFMSHQYPIGISEAKAIGLPVVRANDELYTKMLELLDLYEAGSGEQHTLPSLTGATQEIHAVSSVHVDSEINHDTGILMVAVDAKTGIGKKSGMEWRDW